ncbi:MAG TPA: bifunctional nuclease family protein [Smithellaceae bacterium]|nr:bifunctional nuclease family protein [Smithellaceae bacterium]
MVILKDLQESKAIPIWIGLFEASAIATELEHVVFSRPMTHDLMNEFLKALDVTVNRIEIVDIRNNTFFAAVYLVRDGQTYRVDARPSDAIALALRAGASIFVEESVLEKSRNIDFGIKLADIDKFKEDKVREFLENLSAEDFGKYKM